ncbi:hypothetical protein Tco_0873932 [Tanacetum coccineum]|uniref:Uncharacterized protein n=1 Tax=Tanacetum coccineum TaxID=301880 RepID=A0ABQ5BNB7_9ASTR
MLRNSENLSMLNLDLSQDPIVNGLQIDVHRSFASSSLMLIPMKSCGADTNGDADHCGLVSIGILSAVTRGGRIDGGDDATVEQIKKMAKWDNDEYLWPGRV